MAEEKQYEMPKPHLHEIVHFYDEGNPLPVIAYVRGINPGSIDVVTLVNRLEFAGCRHASDPTLTKNDDRFQFKWDFTESGKILRKLAEVLLPAETVAEEAEEPAGSASE